MRNNDNVERRPEKLFAKPRVDVSIRDDGATILSSPYKLPPTPRCVGDWLVRWARETPQASFLRERCAPALDAPWRALTYSETLQRVEALGAGLLAIGVTPERPLAILSDNGIDHALLALAAQHAGVPVASISPAYSLVSQDHAKLRAIIDMLTPGAVFVPAVAPFAAALAAIRDCFGGVVLTSQSEADTLSLDSLAVKGSAASLADAFAAVTPDTVAKVLFTSGSTGTPKGVINTQRMLTVSQDAESFLWPFVEQTPPKILDWLPWSHTFGANHNFNLVLRNGGTLTIDGGKPAPHLFARTLANIAEGPGNIYFNVPRGFDMLAAALKQDDALREKFFGELQLIFYAGAALPQTVWNDLRDLSMRTIGVPVAMVSAWGSTETSPLATSCHFQSERSGNMGLPVPGVELKLLTTGDKQEIRVRGPAVTPGYWRRPDLTRDAFDEEGFYKIGDAVRFADAADPAKGLLFDGRVAEDFKLTSGTWVNVGQLRVAGIECLAPLAQDIVVCGHDRDSVAFLVFANVVAARALAGLAEDAPTDEALSHAAVAEHMRRGLDALKARGGGSAGHAVAALLMAEPASVDGGEITDKGYVNQRAVLTRRAALVAALYDGDATEVVRLVTEPA